MKKINIALAVAIVGVLVVGCAGQNSYDGFSPSQSSIYAARDGSVSSALVERYEKDHYDQSSFKVFAEEAVIAYNTDNGANPAAYNEEGVDTRLPVALRSCTLEGGTAKVIFDYASSKDLIAFAKEIEDPVTPSSQVESIDIMTVADGLEAGKLVDGSFKKAKDGAAVTNDTITKKGEYYLVTVKGYSTIQTEGKVQYVTDGVSMIDDHTVTTPEGRSYIIFK